MQHHIQTLVKHFFQKESLRDVTLHQLQQFTEEYPWSAAGQLLLARKLHDTNAQDFADQGAKLGLYCSDPVWAAWLLRDEQALQAPGDDSFDAFFRREEPAYQAPDVFPEYKQPAISTESPSPAVDAGVPRKENGAEDASTTATEPVTGDPQPIADVQATPVDPLPEPEASRSAIEGDQLTTLPTGEAEGPLPEPETTKPAIERDQPATPPIGEAKSPLPKIPGPLPVPTPANGNNDDVTFEPYHTIDYFASVGIKLKPEDLADDKLGQQLKSFTEWLRSMKRIGPTTDAQALQELDEGANKQIQRIAETSNTAGEIITEAMAEVWAKQGHREKAAAIYEKLSLLNPAKSHYFATKIEALKGK